MRSRLLPAIAALISLLSANAEPIPQPAMPSLGEDTYTSYDNRSFSYLKWQTDSTADVVVIGVHGISGAANDYHILGRGLIANPAVKALYAYDLRGQGRDPLEEMRGDIRDPRHWFRDLYTFTDLIRAQHPTSKIIWMGESLGTLIVANAFAAAPTPPCDAVILASPVTALRRDFPQWKITLARAFAAAFPKMRLSLETLGGGGDLRVVEGVDHTDQAATNDYHVHRHTLRLFNTIGDLITRMRDSAESFQLPVLVLNAGRDLFSDPSDVATFIAAMPDAALPTQHFYPDSFHLLFYDQQGDRVVQDTISWIESLE